MINPQSNPVRPPPSFEQANNSRQKARSAGLDPDRWYAVEYNKTIKTGQVREVVFWDTSIALYRTEDGKLSAVENRCPHRQLKLHHGAVEGCKLRCAYHGWAFDQDGWLVDYSHDSFGKSLLKKQLRTFPVMVRYGLIWIFPGNPALAESQQPPLIPELEGETPWANMMLDFTWDTHHSMVVENVCDFAHAFLHRKYRPFTDAKLTHYESDDNRVFLKYDTFVAGGRFSGIFIDRQRVNTRAMELCYEYPYQWSNTGDKIRHWCFFLPINESKTRVFFLFYFDALKIPMTQVKMPRMLQEAVLNIAKPLLFAPLLKQDGMALEAEMQAYSQHWDAPPVELNPIIPLFQKLTASHWENYLVRSGKLQPVPAE